MVKSQRDQKKIETHFILRKTRKFLRKVSTQVIYPMDSLNVSRLIFSINNLNKLL